VGAELDANGPARYVITVEQDTVRVQNSQGFERLFDIPALRRLALDAVSRRAAWPVVHQPAPEQAS
jgi:hypothetical protein